LKGAPLQRFFCQEKQQALLIFQKPDAAAATRARLPIPLLLGLAGDGNRCHDALLLDGNGAMG
jgi:hypothetical protein